MQIATSKNLTILGVLTIVGALIAAAISLLDGDPATNPQWEALGAALTAGVGMILAKGQANTGGSVPSTPEAATRVARGFATPAVTGPLFFVCVCLLWLVTGCAALSKTSGSSGNIDLGKGVICSITASPTDPVTCTKAIAQSCQVPLPKDADGHCMLDAIALSIPFEPGKGWKCVVSAGAGVEPCTKSLVTSCSAPVPRDASGACP